MRTIPVAVSCALFLVPILASGGLLLNEVNIDPPGTDDAANLEYIELISTSGGVESANGLTLLLIDSNNGGYGKIRKRWSLQGLSTGADGLLIVGNNYPVAFPYGSLPAGAGVGDPVGPDSFGNGDIGSNGGLTLFLVSGFNPSAPLDLDLDDDDNGQLEIVVWTTLVDAVGFDDTDPSDPPNRQTYATANLSQPSYFPENVSRKAGDLRPNTAGAWFGGQFPSSPNGLQFDPLRMFQGFPGAGATPGTSNAPLQVADLRINEVSINPNGNDENLEFVELVSVSGERGSTNGYSLVIIANDPLEGDVGTIEQAWELSGLQTGENGLLLVGDGYAKPFAGQRAHTPFKNLVEIETEAGDLPSMGRNEIEPSNGISVLLVRGFSGAAGMDLDPDNDGALNASPWEAMTDSVGFDFVNNFTGTRTVSYALGRLEISGFYPDNLSRIAGDLSPHNPDAWYGGDYGGDSQASLGFDEFRFLPAGVVLEKPRATPGQRNLSATDPPYQRDILLNEILLDAPPSPSNSDDNIHEFIEIISANGRAEVLEGIVILLVDTEPGSAQFGVIRQMFDLTGLSTGPNGLCVIGDSYNDLLLNAPVPFDTNREDPQRLNAGDLSPNDGLTVLLVEGFSGALGADLDSDDDGVFEVRPWQSLLDGIGFGGIADSEVANVSQTQYHPDTMARLPGSVNAPNRLSREAWCGGILVGSPEQTRYGTSYFGPFRGGFTRGYGNHAAPPAEEGTVLINEVILKPAAEGPGDRAECLEILATTLDARSLSGYTLVLLDSKGSSIGEIRNLWDLSGLATGPNGLLLAGEDFGTSVPFTIDPETGRGTLLGMKSGDIGDDDALSLLLVKGLRPTVNEGTDLDVSVSASLNDDGNLDFQPWAAIVDSVGFREYDGGLSANVGITYAGADLTRNYEAEALARLAHPSRLNPETAADWYGGSFSGNTAYAFAFDPGETFGIGAPARATPGYHNLGGVLFDAETRDEDKDGRTGILEMASGSDPRVPDVPEPMGLSLVTVNGMPHLSVSYPRLPGGSLEADGQYVAAGIRYVVESSRDLAVWTSLPVVASGSVVAGSPPIEMATMRSSLPLEDPTDPLFVRLRITRETSP